MAKKSKKLSSNFYFNMVVTGIVVNAISFLTPILVLLCFLYFIFPTVTSLIYLAFETFLFLMSITSASKYMDVDSSKYTISYIVCIISLILICISLYFLIGSF